MDVYKIKIISVVLLFFLKQNWVSFILALKGLPPCLFLSPYKRVTGDSEFIVHHSIKPGSHNAHCMEGEITT